MRKNKNNKIYVVLLIICFIALGYSLISSKLNINGSAGINKNTWSIHWDSNSISETTGSVTATVPAYVSDSKKEEITFSVDLNVPKEFYEFTADIVNDGTLDGNVEKIDVGFYEEDETTEQDVSDLLEYSLKYYDGTEIKENDKIEAGTSKKVKFRLQYKDVEELPETPKSVVIKVKPIITQDTNTYKITFDSMGGSEVASKTVEKGKAIGTLPVSSKEAYGFDGWYTASEGGSIINVNTVPTGDVTYYAHWGEMVASNTVNNVTTYHTTLRKAIDASNTGVATLLKDTSELITVYENINKTIDLNNHTLTGKIYNVGNISIGGGTITDDSSYTIANNGIMTITDGVYTTTNSSTSNIYNRAKLTINGGNFDSTNNSDIINTNTGDITINGGMFRSLNTSAHQAIYNNGGMVTINGGTFYGGRKTLHVTVGGTLNIKGGTFSNSDTTGTNIIGNLGTVNISGNPTLTCNAASYATISTQSGSVLNISGGTINTGSTAINTYANSTTTISGGSIISNNNANKWAVAVADGAIVNVTGGLIRTDYRAGAFKVYEGGIAYIRGGKFWNTNPNTTLNVIAIYGYAEISGGEMIQASAANANTHVFENAKLIIDDATITSNASGSMALYSAGDLTLNGGTFTSSYYAVYIYSGNYTYTAGNINGPFCDNRLGICD